MKNTNKSIKLPDDFLKFFAVFIWSLIRLIIISGSVILYSKVRKMNAPIPEVIPTKTIYPTATQNHHTVNLEKKEITSTPSQEKIKTEEAFFKMPTNKPVVGPAQSSRSSKPNSDTSWFVGGTLHKSKIREWRNASYSNRLATSADFIAATQKVDYGNLNKFKQMAIDLEKCISIASEGGAADNEQVTFISAICTVRLFQ